VADPPDNSPSLATLVVEGAHCRTTRRPLRAPFRTALREVRELDAVEVEVRWSGSLVTAAAVSPTPPITGETTASICAAAEGPLAEAVRGVPLAHHEELFRRLHHAMHGNTTAKCAIDLAVHAALAAPSGGLAPFLGAAGGPVRTDVTVSLAGAEAMAAEAVTRVEEGFDVLKLKIGGNDVDLDVARVCAVAKAVGPGIALRLDANQGWSARNALAVLDRLDRAGIRPELVEQPVPAHDLKGMATVARHGFVPVLADESVHSARDVLRIAEAGAADLVNLKLAKCGGLRAARDFLAAAAACELGVIVGCMLEPAPTVAVAATLASALPGGRAHDLDGGWWSADHRPLRYSPPSVVVAGR
jgi:L-Ala-D/L-Glu epimerase